MIRFWSVHNGASKLDRDGFVRAYQAAFGGTPAFKGPSREEVLQKVWHPHVRDGIIVLALDNERVVGFGCALPLLKAPADVQGFMKSLGRQRSPINFGRTWYMSELGVLVTHRGRGLGLALIKHRLLTIHHRGGDQYVLRTTGRGPSSIGLYRKIGAVRLNGLQDVSASRQTSAKGSPGGPYMYLYGDCNSAIKKLIVPAA